MPTKKAAAARTRAKPLVPAAGSSRARPKTKKESDDDDDEISFGDERPPPPKKRTLAPAAAPAKKQPPKAESGSDVEMADDAQPRPPAKQKKATLASKDLDSDSGDDLVRAALEKGKGKATQAQTSKRKS